MVPTSSQTRPDRPLAIPVGWRRLVDDAAIFPPGNAPLMLAVQAHREHRLSPYADLVGPFVVDDLRLPELIEVVNASPVEPLKVTVVVKGGQSAVRDVVQETRMTRGLDLRSLEVPLPLDGNLAGHAQRLTRTLDELTAGGHLSTQTPVFVEPPMSADRPTRSWLTTLDVLAAAGHRLKLRTGGVTAAAFPGCTALATSIVSAVQREMAFKCTAGLHHAVRHRDNPTGFEHHGFVNVLVATAAGLSGGDPAELAGLLDERDPATLSTALGPNDDETLVAARRWFTSFGCCDVLDPLRDLTGLHLLGDGRGCP